LVLASASAWRCDSRSSTYRALRGLTELSHNWTDIPVLCVFRPGFVLWFLLWIS
jgi:hypothetical protein